RDLEGGPGVAEEVTNTGRVHDVHLVLVPLDVAEASRERMLAGDFFLVEVRDGRAFVDLPEPVDHACVEQDGGSELGLAGAGVTDERDVPDGGGVIDLHSGATSQTKSEGIGIISAQSRARKVPIRRLLG